MPTVVQSALHPAGPGAAGIHDLWWIMFWTCAVVYLLVMGALAVAVLRRRGDAAVQDRRLTRAVTGASAVTLVILFGLLFAGVSTGRAVGPRGSAASLVVEITGAQWWWDVEYADPNPSRRVRTANELYLPVGQHVRLDLKSQDVIHSFWVPNLHGKMDLIPGRRNMLSLRVDKPGIYRGQCAEFCGLQHAHMALLVIAVSPEEFERWLEAQRSPAPPPQTPQQEAGRQLVERGPCALCHTVRGTSAGGRTAPDLTHVGSRRTIAAGTVPNTRDDLARWVANPQAIKPGAKMPAVGLSPRDLDAVLAYLETLR